MGAVVTRVARHAQAQRMSLLIRQDVDLVLKAAPAAAEGRIHLFLGRACRTHVRAPDRAVPVAPVRIAAIDRVPLLVTRPATIPRETPSVLSSTALLQRDGSALPVIGLAKLSLDNTLCKNSNGNNL